MTTPFAYTQFFRRWMRRPSYFTTLVVVLGAGLGIAVGSWSLVRSIVLGPVPWRSPDRLLVVHATRPDLRAAAGAATSWNRAPLSWPAWDRLIEAGPFEHTAAWFETTHILVASNRVPVSTLYASSQLFPLLNVRPTLGRVFHPDEDRHPSPSALISYEAWLNDFGASAAVIGTRILAAPTPDSSVLAKTIVGVLPKGARVPGRADLVLPLGEMFYNGRFEANRFLRVIGRLKPDVSRGDALLAVVPLVQGSDSALQRSARLVPFHEELAGGVASVSRLLFGAGAAFFVVAVLAALSLFLGQAPVRSQELRIRWALGGGQRALSLSLLGEHLTIVVSAVAIGGGVSFGVVRALAANVNISQTGVQVNVDWWFLLALGSGVATALGAMVVIEAKRAAERPFLETIPVAKVMPQRLILASQVSIALLLLVLATWFSESFLRRTVLTLGFSPTDLHVIDLQSTAPPLDLPDARQALASPATWRADFDRRLASGWVHNRDLMSRIADLPGIAAVAGTNAAPLAAPGAGVDVRASGSIDGPHRVRRSVVTESYFSLMRVRMLQGRGWSAEDRAAEGAAIVSASFARTVFHDDALGRVFRLGSRDYSVIGVVPDIRYTPLRDEENGTVYVLDRSSRDVAQVLVRVAAGTVVTTDSIRAAVAQSSGGIVATAITPMNVVVDRAFAEQRIRATVTVVLAIGASLMAALGAAAFAVRRVHERRQEVGIRLALGARPAQIVRLLARESGSFLVTGGAIGVCAAWLASTVALTHMSDISPMSWVWCILALVVLAAVIAAATVAPIRRAVGSATIVVRQP